MSHLKLMYPVSSYVASAIIPTTTIVSHQTTNLHFQNPKPNHPQHFLSLLLHNPSHHQSLQQLHSQIITSSLFHHHPFHNNPTSLLLFNNLIRSYSLSSSPHHALHFFTSTLNSLTHPLSLDSFTFTFLSHTCANFSSCSFGFHLHGVIFKLGFQSHVYVQTGLLRMYASWGLLVSAAEVFDEMPQRSIVTWNVFINGLIKWGQLDFARSVFDRMVTRSVVSWTLVIDGYTRVNKPLKALALFRKMVEVDGIEPNEVTLLAVFPAIASLGYIKMCRSVHGCVEKRGFNAVDIRIVNSLIDLYAKCGCIESASRVFSEMPEWRKNLVSWNSVISGFAIFGMVREAVETFERMEKAGVRPNHVAFLSVLSACSHGGLVEEGLEFFGKMVNDYGLVPDVKHYGCVIDMLGRAGRLEEAEKVALQVPREVANDVIWRTLLGACSVHDNVEIGQRVTKKILEMEKGHGGDYVLMSNILAGVGRFKDVERLREMIDTRNAFKLPGYSLV
ncbi:pentatricopeptide repeat-containing protein At1g09220, mitochondrial [Vicia villosa]|uniref:pentatricopeptide repeat-containing protein At1g09220, mitochondrial n=1 Tax=Vicia villosa TaxID=3911 RepID=UPI00273B23DE|nr:pentatricopeptide repeat-containing protein At1g09220, mitochondrial [Vicia villosa]